MMVALVFVLARNILKLVVERRRALPFARFRAKLVTVLLGMTLIPAVLVLIVGSELIRNSANRWFSAPIDQVLRQRARDRQRLLRRAAAGGERACRRTLRARSSALDLAPGNVAAIRAVVAPEVDAAPVEPDRGLSHRQRGRDTPHGRAGRRRRRAVAAARVLGASPIVLAARTAAGGAHNRSLDPLADRRRAGARRRADPRRARRARRPASSSPAIYLTGELARALAAHHRRLRRLRAAARAATARSKASTCRSSSA